ncbi:N-acetylmuramoyl-L-alanine amidase family protein [Sutcliffiella halmapala]|uniref:N-acetylmuramoyl-L-alanine amidase family protein n=1 Tax=Sutcliffiella halmapala TaxID=79882 RepID=UPI00099513F5|nr:N-acetylmuramoyl-L-alanine amidase [Sutcliffiella halmapala]
MKIVIDAGHGPQTAGKRSPDNTMLEFHFNSVVASYVTQELLTYENVQVLHTHESNRDVPLTERTNKANAWNADVLVSIHANAYGSGGFNNVRGIETFSWNGNSPNGDRLAAEIQKQMMSFTKHPKNRGHKRADFHMLREFNRAAALVECGFMTNQEDLALLKSDAYRRTCARAIVAGIVAYGNLKKKPITIPVPPKPVPPKEEPFMLNQAIVINSFADYPNAEALANRLNCPIFTRNVAWGKQVAKELFVVGGTTDDLKADKFVVLSGRDRFETAANVKNYLG